MFLTKQELRSLTGRAHSRKQIEWLLNRGWPFELDANMAPKVLKSVMFERMGGRMDNQEPSLNLTDEAA